MPRPQASNPGWRSCWTNSRADARSWTPGSDGTSFDVPGGWKPRTAENGRGIIYQRPGAKGSNADSIRITDPTKQHPKGYFRYYNSRGQPLDSYGRPGSPGATPFPEDYQGPLPGWPR